jgi:hypothetical protein
VRSTAASEEALQDETARDPPFTHEETEATASERSGSVYYNPNPSATTESRCGPACGSGSTSITPAIAAALVGTLTNQDSTRIRVGNPNDADPRGAFASLTAASAGVEVTIERVDYDAAAVAREVAACGIPPST